MLGLQRGTVQLVRYDPKWEQSFRREAKKIQKVFGKDALDIQHVGSTAIAGIVAKPIIDIALVVSSLAKAKRYIKQLEKIGYTLKQNDTRKERLFFTKGPQRKRTHYLHIGAIKSEYAQEMVLFRDYLLAHGSTAKRYSRLKEKLARAYPDQREAYAAKKEKFIAAILKK